jgi:putative endonuclease
MEPTVYILYFDASNKYYIGSTNNLKRRLQEHEKGHTPSTKRLGNSFKLVFHQTTSTLALARTAEYRIKSWKRRDYIERIIDEGRVAFLEYKGV